MPAPLPSGAGIRVFRDGTGSRWARHQKPLLNLDFGRFRGAGIQAGGALGEAEICLSLRKAGAPKWPPADPASLAVSASVPSMGCVLPLATYCTGPMAATVAKRTA